VRHSEEMKAWRSLNVTKKRLTDASAGALAGDLNGRISIALERGGSYGVVSHTRRITDARSGSLLLPSAGHAAVSCYASYLSVLSLSPGA